MQCIIHAGLHHTGTTSFQHFLFNNRDLLAKSKILYPLSGIYKNSFQHSLIPGSYIDKHLFIDEKRNRNIKDYLYSLEKEIIKKNYELCIISSEVFTELLQISEERLNLLFKELSEIFEKITIFITTREPEERAITQLKKMLRLSESIPAYRTELFNAPELFINKIKSVDKNIKRWSEITNDLIICNMDENDYPLRNYFENIIKVLPKQNQLSIKEEINLKNILNLSNNFHDNKDPHELYKYIFCILIGIKIKNSEETLKNKFTFLKVIEFMEKIKSSENNILKKINKNNLLLLLKNYSKLEFGRNNIMEILLSANINLSATYILDKLLNEFIYNLITND